MPFGWSWNLILTISALTLSLITAFFQVRDFRARPADPTISRITEPTFQTRTGDDIPDGKREARFDFHAMVENEGRSRFTASRVVLDPEIGEDTELFTNHASSHDTHEFDGRASRTISYTGDVIVPADHPDEIRGTV